MRKIGRNGSGYKFTPSPTGTLVAVGSDDSVVWATGVGTCSTPRIFSDISGGPGVWPVEVVTKPANLVGPLTVSVQN